MAGALFSNGRVVVATSDWRREVRRRELASRAQLFQPEDEAPPVEALSPVLGVPWKDAQDGVTYRVVERLNLADGWVTVATMMRWFGVPRSVVLAWVQNGLVDAAFEQHTPTKRYRIKDPAAVTAEVTKLRSRVHR